MKTVLSNKEKVTQQWIAHNLQAPAEAPTSNQIALFFSEHQCYSGYYSPKAIATMGRSRTIQYINETIYSFGAHFAIAHFTNNLLAPVLFTSRGYSSSTGHHKAVVRSELIKNRLNYIEVNNPQASTQDEHLANIIEMRRSIVYTYGKIDRARANKPKHIATLALKVAQHNAYIDAFVPNAVYWDTTTIEQDMVEAKLGGTL